MGSIDSTSSVSLSSVIKEMQVLLETNSHKNKLWNVVRSARVAVAQREREFTTK